MYVFSYILFPVLKYWDEDWASIPFLFERSAIPGAVFWAVVGLAALCFGYRLHLSIHVHRSKLLALALRKERLWELWIGTIVAAAVIPLWSVYLHGLEFLIFHRDEAFRGEGITLFLYGALVNYSSIFALLLFKFRKSVAVVIAQAVFVLLASFGSRGLLVVFLMSLGLVSFAGRVRMSATTSTRKRRIFGYAAIGVCLFLTFCLVFFRQSEGAQEITDTVAKRALANTFEEGEMFSLVREHYSNHLLYGQTLWDIRYILLPRQIFPNKPLIYGKGVFERDLGFMDIYPSADPLYGPSAVFGQLSELYANFGGPGIILGMAAWGWAYAFMEGFRREPLESAGFFLYLLFFFYQFWFFRHGLLGLVQGMIIPALLTPIFLKLAYARSSPWTSR